MANPRALTKEQVLEIADLYPSIGCKTLSKLYGVPPVTITDIAKKRTYKDIERPDLVIRPPTPPTPEAVANAILRLYIPHSRVYGQRNLAEIFGLHINTIYNILKRNKARKKDMLTYC